MQKNYIWLKYYIPLKKTNLQNFSPNVGYSLKSAVDIYCVFVLRYATFLNKPIIVHSVLLLT